MTILFGALALLLAYGTAVEPRLILDVERETAFVPHLPPQWEGRAVAATADFQVGMWLANRGMMRRVVRRLIRERPAAVLLVGDFIYFPPEHPAELVREALEVVRPLAESGIPVYAVLGNHDWGLDVRNGTINRTAARLVREGLEEMGIPVLDNRAVRLGDAEGGLWIAGIGSAWAGDDDPLRALAEVRAGAARVVFMHNPDSFEEIPAGAAPLAIAAHTHGGQVRIPFLPEWSWLTWVRDDRVHTDGWIDKDYGAAGNRLYVNRGVGFSDVPVRINAAPEITVFELRRPPGDTLPARP